MRIIKHGNEGRSAILEGVNKTVDLVKLTMGGKGQIVMIDTPGEVHPTMDGVTVIRHTAMNDTVEDMGVKLVIECAEKQVAENGDGTTSVSVVLQALANEGQEALLGGADANVVNEQIIKAAELVCQELKDIAVKINRDSEEVYQIAKISAHGDEKVARLVAEAIAKTTKNSMLTVVTTPFDNCSIDLTKGFKTNSGYLSEKFITNNEKMITELYNPYVLVYEGKIHSFPELMPLMVQINQQNRPVVIISDDLNGDALGAIAVNNQQGKLSALAINPYGHSLDDTRARLADLAIATGGIVVSPDSGHRLEEVTLDMLGSCDKVIGSATETVFVGGQANEGELSKRISDLQSQLSESTEKLQKELLTGRLAALDGGFGIIKVGGTMASEVKELKDRVDDALGAVLAALEFGIVPGGGVSLLKAREVLKEENIGTQILYDALEKPFEQILINAGKDVKEITKGVLSRPMGTGFDVVADDYVEMYSAGIIDPAKVEISVVKNAVAVFRQFLRTAALISHKQD